MQLDKYDSKGDFGGLPGSKLRALVYFWSHYVVSEIDETVINVFIHTVALPPQQRDTKLAMNSANKFRSEIAPAINQAFVTNGGPFFTGKQVTKRRRRREDEGVVKEKEEGREEEEGRRGEMDRWVLRYFFL